MLWVKPLLRHDMSEQAFGHVALCDQDLYQIIALQSLV